jgi:hypothetical protein
MATFDLFSKRERRRRGDIPDVYASSTRAEIIGRRRGRATSQ